MEENINLENLLDLPENRFPSDYAGQKLFIRGEDSDNNAMLNWTSFPLDLYAGGYKDAADTLARVLLDRKAPMDSAIYPLVFLYRQGIELQLKLILPLARRLNGEKTKKDLSHGLKAMWKELRDILATIDPREEDLELPAMENFIMELHEIDPESFAFRYPTDRKGNATLPDLTHINIRHLAEIMDSVFLMFMGIHSYLGEMERTDGSCFA